MPRRVCWTLLALLALAPLAAAQELADSAAGRGPRFLLAAALHPVPVDVSRTPVLRKRLSLDLGDVPLKVALTTIAQQSGLDLVYSDDVLPVGARVSLRADGITVAAALTDVLADADVDVVFSRNGRAALVPRAKAGVLDSGSVRGRVTDAKTGQAIVGASVVLAGTRWRATSGENGQYRITEVAPRTYTLTASRIGYSRQRQSVTVVGGQETTVEIRLEVSASPLDAVVVTGTIAPTEQKELSNPITVVTAEDIQRRGITQINELFRGEIPGVFAADYGNAGPTLGAPVYVRGGSALFNLPVLKTYLDGVELANSEFLNEIDPTMIDHIEIIRGPEASTLYGAQAITGVMQVFTKKGRLTTPPHLGVSVGMGALEGPYSTGVRHQDNVSLMGGTSDLSYNLGLSYQHDGAWSAGHYLNVYSGYGSLSLRPPASPVQVDVTARIGQQGSQFGGVQGTAREMMDGTLRLDPNRAVPVHNVSSLPQQTLGVSARYAASPNWQHTLTVGLDRGASGIDYVSYPAYRSPSDTLTTVYSTETTRLTAAYNSAFDWRLADRVLANVIVGADRWDYQLNGFDTYGTTTDVGSLGTSGLVEVTRERDHNTGVFSQVRLGVSEALFLTAGVRVDEGPDLPADRHHRFTAPRLGASYAFGIGSIQGKFRAGYGSALKPAYPGYKRSAQYSADYVQVGNPNLLPERQTGWDGGVDLYAGDRASLSVTHYRQLARDLIAIAFLAYSPVFTQQFQNVARVRNTGWELEGSLRLGLGLTAKATYSVVESIVDSLAPGNQTAYHVGDAVPGVPHHTGALSLTERTARLSAEVGVSYLGSSSNYDPRAWTLRAFTRLGTPSYVNPFVTLPPAYRLALRFGYDVTPRIALFAQGENLTNRVVVESGFFAVDQLGRTTVLGLRVR